MSQENLVIKQIKEMDFVVFDLETTGGNHQNDKIIEIGLVKIQKLKIVDKKSFLIDPEMKIPDFIQKLTHIKQKDVANAPKIEDVIEEILEFMGNATLVAHNTSFDVPFFNSVLRRLKIDELENPSICTNLMTKYLIPNLQSSNLNYMSKIFNIKHKKAHRALDDAQATAELILKYLNIFIKKDIEKLNHLYYPRNRYELDRCHYKVNNENNQNDLIQKIKDLKTSALLTLKGEHGIILYTFPFSKNSKENSVTFEHIKSLSWNVATLKYFGPFLETLIHFNGLISKLENQLRKKVMSELWSTYLSETPFPKNFDETTSDSNHQIWKELGDFVISNHLVPEQMVIYPLGALNLKNQLIFRYPGHKKKLIQYINSKSQKVVNKKGKKDFTNPLMKAFIEHYLIKQKKSGNTILFVKKKQPLQNTQDFYDELEQFMHAHSKGHNYPISFI